MGDIKVLTVKNTNRDTQLLNFDKNIQYENIVPVKFKYFLSPEIVINTWSDLVVYTAKFLFNDCPRKMRNLAGRRIETLRSILIGNSDVSSIMNKPIQFTRALFIETDLTVEQIIKSVKYLMDECGMDYQRIKVYYSCIRERLEKNFRITEKISSDTDDKITLVKNMPKQMRDKFSGSQNIKVLSQKSNTQKKDTRTLWDQYETAILIDAYEQVEKNIISEKEAISSVSIILRERAINQGFEIEESFRNKNGITWQYNILENIMSEGRTGHKQRQSVFSEIAHLYKTNRGEFNKILDSARKDIPYGCLAKQGNIADKSLFNNDLDKVTVTDSKEVTQKNQGLQGWKIKTISLNNSQLEDSKILDKRVEKSKRQDKVDGLTHETAISNYSHWLREKRHYNHEQIDREIAALEYCEQLARETNIISNDFICSQNADLTKEVYLQLSNLRQFNLSNKIVKGAYSNSITNFITYLASLSQDNKENSTYSISHNNTKVEQRVRVTEKSQKDEELRSINSEEAHIYNTFKAPNFSQVETRIHNVIAEEFQKGFRKNSKLEYKRFVQSYESKFGTGLSLQREELEKIISNASIEIDGAFFLIEMLLSLDEAVRLDEWIQNKFDKEVKVIYYDTLLCELKDELAFEKLNNIDLLKAYLENRYKGN